MDLGLHATSQTLLPHVTKATLVYLRPIDDIFAVSTFFPGDIATTIGRLICTSIASAQRKFVALSGTHFAKDILGVPTSRSTSS